MPTNEERREVAEKFRKEADNGEPFVTASIVGLSDLSYGDWKAGRNDAECWNWLADLIEPDVDQDIKGLYQIGADRITKDGSDTLVLYGDNALPDVIECDCTPYTRVDRQALLYLARDLEVSVMDSGAVSSVVEMIMNIAKEIRKACGE